MQNYTSFSNRNSIQWHYLPYVQSNENKMNEKCIKTHVNLLHMWWGRVHEVRSYPGGAWHTVTRQCLTVVTAVLCQSRRRKHVSCSNAVLTNATRVIVQSHILQGNMKIIEICTCTVSITKFFYIKILFFFLVFLYKYKVMKNQMILYAKHLIYIFDVT